MMSIHYITGVFLFSSLGEILGETNCWDATFGHRPKNFVSGEQATEEPGEDLE
jgi:hypothetical protein